MNTRRPPAHVFRVRDEAGGRRREFMWAESVAGLKSALATRLARLAPGETLWIDFTGVGMSSDAARAFLGRALLQIQIGGGLHGRGIVLRGLERGLYNIQVMLESEDLTAIVEEAGGGVTLLGSAEQAARETFEFLSRRPSARAREVKEHFGLKSVAAATNRLARLADLGLVRRIGQESADGGGVQYVYAAVH